MIETQHKPQFTMENGFDRDPAIVNDIMNMIQDLCDIAGYGIHSGIKPGKSADRAARYIVEKLHGGGLTSAHLEEVSVNNPFPVSYTVSIQEDAKTADLSRFCYPIQWTAGTSPTGMRGKLAYVGDGSQSFFDSVDVAGKIALIDEKFMRGYIATAKEAASIAKDKGAVAIIRANLIVDSPQQQKNEGTSTNIFPIPSFCASSQAGDFLRELALSGRNHSVFIHLDAPHDVCTAFNVVFELPGNGNSEEMLLVGTHYDTGHFTGAVDNNGSVALMIKLAHYFASRPLLERNRSMMFAFCMGHDCDLNSGHYQFAKAHKEQLSRAIVWDVDHAVGGIRYVYDEAQGKIVPVDGETCEFYIISNNYSFSRLAAFSMDRYGFICTHNRFETTGRGPQWGIAPDTCPWVNVASIPLYYHSILDTPDKITSDQVQRAYLAHREVLENLHRVPEGFLYYDNIRKDPLCEAPRVALSILSDKVCVGDTVKVWNDETRFFAPKTSYHCTALPEWCGTRWDWGDGTPITEGGPVAQHAYSTPGVYTITFSFTDTCGNSAHVSRDVTVLGKGTSPVQSINNVARPIS
jgi:hypothetical protein